MQSLTEVKAGTECTIKWMFGAPQVMELMNQYDIKEAPSACLARDGTAPSSDGMMYALPSEVRSRRALRCKAGWSVYKKR